MKREALSPADEALIQTARDLIQARYKENRHHISAALRAGSGKVYTGVHLDTYVGRASVCAEAIALGRALTDGETAIDAIVSVRQPRPRDNIDGIQVVSPCGICRELLTDFAPEARIILRLEEGLARIPVGDLLPAKYKRKTE
jgi:cytidine deaminase